MIVDAGLQKYLEEHPVTDAELKPEYDAQVAAMPREYHARHILVEDKAMADSITKDLKGGADFAKLAEQKSKDSSGKSGGDLGWFTLDTMVKPFADAVAALQPGQLTEQPVQSQFGWHVIKLEESRASAPPAFEEVKDRVKVIVQRKKLQTYLEDLRKNAKIEKVEAAAEKKELIRRSLHTPDPSDGSLPPTGSSFDAASRVERCFDALRLRHRGRGFLPGPAFGTAHEYVPVGLRKKHPCFLRSRKQDRKESRSVVTCNVVERETPLRIATSSWSVRDHLPGS